jgi:hypothetical protein
MSKTYNAILRAEGSGKPFFSEIACPRLGGPEFTGGTPRALLPNEGGVNNGPYLMDIPAQWKPSLVPRLSVQTDGETALLRIKPEQTRRKRRPTLPVNISCVPVNDWVIEVDPATGPYTEGMSVTFSLTGGVGSPPITYLWRDVTNAIDMGTTASVVYVLATTGGPFPYLNVYRCRLDNPCGFQIVTKSLVISS